MLYLLQKPSNKIPTQIYTHQTRTGHFHRIEKIKNVITQRKKKVTKKSKSFWMQFVEFIYDTYSNRTHLVCDLIRIFSPPAYHTRADLNLQSLSFPPQTLQLHVLHTYSSICTRLDDFFFHSYFIQFEKVLCTEWINILHSLAHLQNKRERKIMRVEVKAVNSFRKVPISM